MGFFWDSIFFDCRFLERFLFLASLTLSFHCGGGKVLKAKGKPLSCHA